MPDATHNMEPLFKDIRNARDKMTKLKSDQDSIGEEMKSIRSDLEANRRLRRSTDTRSAASMTGSPS